MYCSLLLKSAFDNLKIQIHYKFVKINSIQTYIIKHSFRQVLNTEGMLDTDYSAVPDPRGYGFICGKDRTQFRT